MKIELNTLTELADLLLAERKCQKLTRAQAVALCAGNQGLPQPG